MKKRFIVEYRVIWDDNMIKLTNNSDLPELISINVAIMKEDCDDHGDPEQIKKEMYLRISRAELKKLGLMFSDFAIGMYSVK